MTEVSELVALLSKAERGYTKVLNRSFQNAGYDLSREQYELAFILRQVQVIFRQAIVRFDSGTGVGQTGGIEYLTEKRVCTTKDG